MIVMMLLEEFSRKSRAFFFSCVQFITVNSNSYEQVKTFRYSGFFIENIKILFTREQNVDLKQKIHFIVRLSSRLLSKNLKIKIYKTVILPVFYMVVNNGFLHSGGTKGI